MAALDKIRLTGLLRQAPLRRGFLVLGPPKPARPGRGSQAGPARAPRRTLALYVRICHAKGQSSRTGRPRRAEGRVHGMTDIRHPLFARFFDRLSRLMEKEIGPRRDELLAGLTGRVVAVGAGNGINFAHYPPTGEEAVAIAPEP